MKRWGVVQWAGLLIVLALHGAAVYGLWRARLIPSPERVSTVFVSFIDPPAPVQRPVPKPRLPDPPKPVKPRPPEPPHYHLATQAPVLSPAEPVMPVPPPVIAAPAPEAETPAPEPAPPPAAPVSLKTELAVSCSFRPEPEYPARARRMNEEGKVIVRVELDEAGRITTTRIERSSGSRRLDEAALTTVKRWQCNPAQRDGASVRAVALQAFNFHLE